ncbi:alpha/beta fold hydrolase [Natronobacterium texcoconense]|uniref:Pimeloyl-ACP methyl ester carboxylesterase n=1 Tax=Natronobacterium texcoconense TaxID=1095778 RepID=A0A1H1GC21_NATTX|nr:alpha/beta hydrolase [Natronobacterium texcoconense]SDR10478.1 Pimeloyl-ACP methyl ester carboxylesterase [Natronobacterium texcoconense]
MERVTHHGRETAYEIVGESDDPSVCCVHGTGGNRDLWQGQHSLADDHSLVTLDLSGHGDSADIDASPGYATLSAYVDDVLAVVEETDVRTLIGSSLGGAVVLQLLLERSFRPDAVVLTGTGARLGVLEDLLSWLETDFDRAVEFLHARDCFFHDPDRDVVTLSKEAMYDSGREVTSRDFHSCHGFDVRDRLSEIDVPTLVVYGEYDRLTPPWFHEFLADEIPDAEIVAIEDAAQLAMLERPEPFNEAVRTFL